MKKEIWIGIIVVVVIVGGILIFSRRGSVEVLGGQKISQTELESMIKANSDLQSYQLQSSQKIFMIIQGTSKMDVHASYNGYIDRENKRLLMTRELSKTEEMGGEPPESENSVGTILVKDGKITLRDYDIDEESYDDCEYDCSMQHSSCVAGCTSQYWNCRSAEGADVSACGRESDVCSSSCYDNEQSCIGACAEALLNNFDSLVDDFDNLDKIVNLTKNGVIEQTTSEGGYKVIQIAPSPTEFLSSINPQYASMIISNQSIKKLYVKYWLKNNIIAKDAMYLNLSYPGELDMIIDMTHERTQLNSVPESVFEIT